jgi:hypothetical protein
MPAPRLIVDLEGGSDWLERPKVYWDPTTQAPPVYDGTWETCVVRCLSWAPVPVVMQWLLSGQHPFVSVGIDSFSEAQTRYKDQLFAGMPDSQQEWGRLLQDMEAVVCQLRDMRAHPTSPLRAVVFTCGTVDKDGLRKPMLQGALQDRMPHKVDMCAYMSMMPAGQGFVNNMLIMPIGPFIAKSRGRMAEVLGYTITNPRVDVILATLEEHGVGV